MIIWLASYPKSGNTLLRSILSSYFFSYEGNFKFNNLYKIIQFPLAQDFSKLGINIDNEEDVFKNFIRVQNTINDNNKNVKFFKTHSSLCEMYGSNFTDLKNLEKTNSFSEAVKNKDGKKIPFFDKGAKRDWSKSLDLELKLIIENNFRKEMLELGYL